MSNAASYRLQVSTNAGFGDTVLDQDRIDSNTYPVSGLSDGMAYSWRVNASNALGASGWSPTWSFTTRAPTAPVTAWSFPADISGTQGFNNWYYAYYRVFYGNGTYCSLTWNGSSWMDPNDSYVHISSTNMQSGAAVDVALAWLVPSGVTSVNVTGTVADADAGGGDGIVATIKNGSTVLWGPTTIADGNTTGSSYELTASVAEADTLYFIVNRNGNQDNDRTSWNIQIGHYQVGDPPTFDPPAGHYADVQSVTITCTTPGAMIYYTTDGSAPSSSSTPYVGPINVSTNTTVKAIALASGWADAVATARYRIGLSSNYRMKIAFNGYTNRTQMLTNFPALVVFSNGMGGTDFDFGRYPFLSTNGYDLRFWDSSHSVPLNYEIEQWNTDGPGFVWVQVPAIASDGSSYIWARWDNAAEASQLPCTTNGAVWANGFAGVWHMNQTDALDSTANANHGTAVPGMTQGTGQVGPADSFDGSSYINVPDSASLRDMTNLTVSFWLKSNPTSQGYPLTRWASSGSSGYGAVPSLPGWYEGNGTWYNAPYSCPDTGWHYHCFSGNETTATGYTDGFSLSGTTAFGPGPFQSTTYLCMGADNRDHTATLPNGSLMEKCGWKA